MTFLLFALSSLIQHSRATATVHTIDRTSHTESVAAPSFVYCHSLLLLYILLLFFFSVCCCGRVSMHVGARRGCWGLARRGFEELCDEEGRVSVVLQVLFRFVMAICLRFMSISCTQFILPPTFPPFRVLTYTLTTSTLSCFYFTTPTYTLITPYPSCS